VYCFAKAAICCPYSWYSSVFFFDDALFQTPFTPALLCLLVADLSLLLLAIDHLHLIDLGVLRFAFDSDGFGLRPGVLRQLLFVDGLVLLKGHQLLLKLLALRKSNTE